MTPGSFRALVRPLRVFAFDPSLGSRHGNVMTFTVAHEPHPRAPVFTNASERNSPRSLFDARGPLRRPR